MLTQRPAIDVSYENLPIKMLEIVDDVDDLAVVLATPESARLTRRAQAFVEFCRAELSTPPQGVTLR